MCLGPCNYEELLFDTRFSGNCPQWVWSNSNAHRVKIGTNWWAELTASSDVSQTVATGSYRAIQVHFDIEIVPANPGTELLYVEIMRGSTLLETVAVIYPESTRTSYSAYLGNYSNDSITMRFRYAAGTAPGNTIFRVDNACMWGYF
jgi:hypothetical protein